MRAPDFDALLRKGADGLAIQRFSGILVPSPIINTLGAGVIFKPDPGFDLFFPVTCLLKPAGVAGGEVLSSDCVATFSDASTLHTAVFNDPAMTLASNAPTLRYPSVLINAIWEEFANNGASGLGVVQVQYKIKSSIALSLASAEIRLYAYEVAL